jgi:hypothetical protein
MATTVAICSSQRTDSPAREDPRGGGMSCGGRRRRHSNHVMKNLGSIRWPPWSRIVVGIAVFSRAGARRWREGPPMTAITWFKCPHDLPDDPRGQNDRDIEKSASAFDAAKSRTILDLYCNPLTSGGLKKKSGKLKQRLPVTYIEQDPHYRVEPLRRQITEQECPADKSKPARRRPGRPRRVV